MNTSMDNEYTKALDRALAILSRRSVTVSELKKKLTEKGFDAALAEEVADEVKALGYIDDEAYAHMFLEYCLEKLWGKRKIRYEMLQRGLDNGIIEDVLASYDEEALTELIAGYITQKYTDIPDPKTKAKITRHFASRGFDFSIINSAISIATKGELNE